MDALKLGFLWEHHLKPTHLNRGRPKTTEESNDFRTEYFKLIPSLDTHHSALIVIFLDFPKLYSRNVIFIFPKSYQKGARQAYIYTHINVFSLFKICLETISKEVFTCGYIF